MSNVSAEDAKGMGEEEPCSPKIIQLLLARVPSSSRWGDDLLGLGSDGVTYVVSSSGRWVPFIPPLNYKEGGKTETEVRD